VDIQPKVLVVDADAATLTSVASVAEEEGFDVRTAVDADGAIRQCRSDYIDLVLIAPGIDAAADAEVLSSIRILKPSVRALSVEKPIGLDRLHQLFARLRTEPWHEPHSFIAAEMPPPR
jgi:CheY-like chemotaxis protein